MPMYLMVPLAYRARVYIYARAKKSASRVKAGASPTMR